jgi:glycosyltransferase involved in cell wall biosynthesis
MRIAYVVNQYPKVSHSFIRREILALERMGVDVLRLAMRGWDAELVDPEDVAERERTRYALQGGVAGLAAAVARRMLDSPLRLLRALRLVLRTGWRADRPLAVHFVYLAEACWLAEQLREHGSGHLHAHFGTNSATVAMLAGELTGLPFSFTVHGPDEFDRPEFIALPEKIRRARFVVAISSYGRSQLMRWSGHQDWPKIEVVHCGLEQAFHQVPEVAAVPGRRLVCVGRLSAQKGQLLLVEAAARLARQGVDFELVLAGDGELRAPIERLVAHHGLADRVRITGWISSARVREEMQAARALVLPSFAEGLPVVIMEAMALRRAVLTTCIAGIPELVVPGETGWLIPAGSVAELVEAMRVCLDATPEHLGAMGRKARERVLERHDVEREAARLAQLFRYTEPQRVEVAA